MQADLNTILPEIVLALSAIAALLGVAYTGKDRMAVPLVWATAGLMVAPRHRDRDQRCGHANGLRRHDQR